MPANSKFTKRIWMYWENRRFRKKPDYLELCLDTIKRHKGDYELVLLDDRSVTDYIKVPNKVWQFEHIAHRADYIRFQLLHRYGGVWLDADVILLRDIGAAVDPFIQSYDYIGYGREQGKPSINFIACQPGCSLISRHIEKMDDTLDNKQTNLLSRKVKLVWTEIGHDILWPLAESYPYYHHELKMIAPVYWRDWELFLRPCNDLEPYLAHNPYMVMLYNDFMREPLKNKSEKDILVADTLLSKILQKAAC